VHLLCSRLLLARRSRRGPVRFDFFDDKALPCPVSPPQRSNNDSAKQDRTTKQPRKPAKTRSFFVFRDALLGHTRCGGLRSSFGGQLLRSRLIRRIGQIHFRSRRYLLYADCRWRLPRHIGAASLRFGQSRYRGCRRSLGCYLRRRRCPRCRRSSRRGQRLDHRLHPVAHRFRPRLQTEIVGHAFNPLHTRRRLRTRLLVGVLRHRGGRTSQQKRRR